VRWHWSCNQLDHRWDWQCATASSVSNQTSLGPRVADEQHHVLCNLGMSYRRASESATQRPTPCGLNNAFPTPPVCHPTPDDRVWSLVFRDKIVAQRKLGSCDGACVE
jgi:hypothetical protein